MKLLFVNACIRGEQSRTLELCRDFLNKFKEAKKDEDWVIEELDLGHMDIKPLDAQSLAQRDAYMKAGRIDAPMLSLARQIIGADQILIGASYWDLSFPAKLKIYLEQCSVTGLTFIYSPEGIPQGQCHAKHLTYITTSGSAIGEFNFGYDYVKGIWSLFGIGKTFFVSAEELDIIGKDVPAIMARAKDKITGIIKEI